VKAREAPPQGDGLDGDEPYVPPQPEPEESIQHSLFGEILDWMLAPLLLLWPMSIAITYLVAKSIANQPFDHALEDSVTVLAQQVKEADGKVAARLPGSARDILRADDVDSVYFQITGPRGEPVEGDRDLPLPPAEDAERSGRVHFRNETLHGAPVRVAYAWVNLRPLAAPGKDPRIDPRIDPLSEPPLALVQVAETLDKRAQLANEIIKGVILPQFIILPVILALVWFALSRGLSPLAQLQERIRARPPDDLSPIDPRQVPEEISPLVGSLNDMLARVEHTIAAQKRFIADAAHQMKTPLAGMRMQAELALRQVDGDEIHRSLEQLAKSSESATRLVNQLLALARAENQPHAGLALAPLDLGLLARSVVQDWVQASFAHEIDLGYEAPPESIDAVEIAGNPLMLRELLSNLIDNAIRYTPPGGSVTVRVRLAARDPQDAGADADGTAPDAAQQAVLEVEDTGPGIAPAERHRVFERFYRILGTNAPGSGLGLAIVREIARQHGAEIVILDNPHGPFGMQGAAGANGQRKKLPGCLFRLTFPHPSEPEPDAD
jgi:two-component system sensor histidine kinase TctE